jgi:hypothetical protein
MGPESKPAGRAILPSLVELELLRVPDVGTFAGAACTGGSGSLEARSHWFVGNGRARAYRAWRGISF